MAAKRSGLRWFLTALVAVTLAAGCADVPTSGLLQHTARPAGAGGEQQGIGLLRVHHDRAGPRLESVAR